MRRCVKMDLFYLIFELAVQLRAPATTAAAAAVAVTACIVAVPTPLHQHAAVAGSEELRESTNVLL